MYKWIVKLLKIYTCNKTNMYNYFNFDLITYIRSVRLTL